MRLILLRSTNRKSCRDEEMDLGAIGHHRTQTYCFTVWFGDLALALVQATPSAAMVRPMSRLALNATPH